MLACRSFESKIATPSSRSQQLANQIDRFGRGCGRAQSPVRPIPDEVGDCREALPDYDAVLLDSPADDVADCLPLIGSRADIQPVQLEPLTRSGGRARARTRAGEDRAPDDLRRREAVIGGGPLNPGGPCGPAGPCGPVAPCGPGMPCGARTPRRGQDGLRSPRSPRLRRRPHPPDGKTPSSCRGSFRYAVASLTRWTSCLRGWTRHCFSPASRAATSASTTGAATSGNPRSREQARLPDALRAPSHVRQRVHRGRDRHVRDRPHGRYERPPD